MYKQDKVVLFLNAKAEGLSEFHIVFYDMLRMTKKKKIFGERDKDKMNKKKKQKIILLQALAVHIGKRFEGHAKKK